MAATHPLTLLNPRYPVNEFRFASKQDAQTTADPGIWSDIGGLILEFAPNDSGNFLVTLNLPRLLADNTFDLNVQLVMRDKANGDQPPRVLIYSEVIAPSSPVPVTLLCEAQVLPTLSGSEIVAQWKQATQGPVQILADSFASLSAVGSLALSRAVFTDEHHFKYPELFSRGLRLTNYSEVLFLTGYSSTPYLKNDPADFMPLTADLQMQWIVEHLDAFFATIPYANGPGFYSKHDIVYFDLVIDRTVDRDAQNAVLAVLEKWFLDVDPKPSTGILKKIEALAFPSTKVEIEFILAH